MSVAIRDALSSDAEAICGIYNHHVRNTIVTFEETDVSAEEMRGRIASVTTTLPWLIAEENGELTGYAYAAKFIDRSAYRFSVVSTIYVHEKAQRRMIGTNLYHALLDWLRARSFHTAMGVIALPNPASVALHESCGFRKVGHLVEAGFKFGRWIDVGYWQVML